MTKPLSRFGAMAMGAATGFVVPRLAKDQKTDLTPLFANVTKQNYVESLAAICAGIANATKGKLAADTKLDDLTSVLIALDAMAPEEKEEKEDKPEPKAPKGDKKAKDSKKGMDAMPEAMQERLKAKMSSDEWKKACDAMEDYEAAEDETSVEEEEARKAKEAKEAADKKAKDEADKEKDKEESKKAMDAAITNAISGERQRQQAVREAERFVRPWVGDINIAMDSDTAVYGKVLEMRGVKTAGIHESAFKALLEAQPKPGVNNNVPQRIAMDASARDAALKIAPGLSRITRG